MARFLTAAVASLLLLADPSSSTNLRAIAEHGRRLSYELIAFYEPRSQVTDHVSAFLHYGSYLLKLFDSTQKHTKRTNKYLHVLSPPF